jgi:mutual gliding-motility protein MglA
MPNVDHGHRELRFKVVYYGPGLGGKTTNLEYIHARTRPELRGKLVSFTDTQERTLFFDLLPLELGSFKGYTVRFHLCTVPGQIESDRVRRVVLRHVDGVVMVVDSQHERLRENLNSIRTLETNLRFQGDNPAKLPTVVQYNKRDLPNAAGLATIRQELGIPRSLPQFEAVANRGEGVLETFKEIMTQCLGLVGEPASAPAGHSPSIVPGRRVSMFPEAEPAALRKQRERLARPGVRRTAP